MTATMTDAIAHGSRHHLAVDTLAARKSEMGGGIVGVTVVQTVLLLDATARGGAPAA